MLLSELLADIVTIDLIYDCHINSLTDDSRFVANGSLFCAYPGENIDRRKFLPQAVASGASATITEAESACCEFYHKCAMPK